MSKKVSGGSARHHPSRSYGSPALLIGGIALVGIAVLILAWIALAPNRGNGGVPQVQVSAERLELGKQVFGRPIRASFTVTNAGNGALTLQVPRVATVLEGCWPSQIIVGQTILEPGASTTVYTDIVMHEGMDGPHLFEIPLATNDPAQPLKKLLIATDWQPS